MERKITGYHLDDYNDWVAELDCYHSQHVRNNPPFINRPWVETEEGRMSRLGQILNCVRCDRLEMPEGLTAYTRTPSYNKNTIPVELKKTHAAKSGIWGIIHVLEGSLIYTVKSAATQQYELKHGERGIIVPDMPHQLETNGSVSFYLEYLTKNVSIVSS